MKLKQRPEDFSVIESYRYEEDRDGAYYVYRMDKQKLSTLQAVERLRERFHVKRTDVSFCGLKDKQGRTEQIIAVHGKKIDELQDPDLKLTFLGRTREPLSAANITSNRFSVIVRDLSIEEANKVPEAVAEVARVGVVNYFDSQRFGFLKHGQGFIAKDLLRGDYEGALKHLIAQPSELDQSDDAKVKAWFRDHWGQWNEKPPTDGWIKYRPMLQRLRENPYDFGSALLTLDRRMRAMVVFEFQSWMWNESVRRYLETAVPARDRLPIKYQAGMLTFPRAPPEKMTGKWHEKTFPLLAPESTFTDPDVETACKSALAREKLTLAGLVIPKLNAFHFKHEERPLVVFPGKLRVTEPREDEENRGRYKVVLSFTLPPGAYATLVVRRTMWFATTEHAGRHPEAPLPPPRVKMVPTPKKGFLEKQRDAKALRDAHRTGKPIPVVAPPVARPEPVPPPPRPDAPREHPASHKLRRAKPAAGAAGAPEPVKHARVPRPVDDRPKAPAAPKAPPKKPQRAGQNTNKDRPPRAPKPDPHAPTERPARPRTDKPRGR